MTFERGIATRARELVESQREGNSAQHEKETAYRSRCESLPVLLRSAGLCQTVAFLRAKAKASPENGAVYAHLETQLRALGFIDAQEELLVRATDQNLPMPDYRFLSEMAMTVAYWHKRMAQALLRSKEKG